MPNFVSPNDMHKAACDAMLSGKTPESEYDWILIVNFYAANVHPSVAIEAVRLICTLFNCPLTDYVVTMITALQVEAQSKQAS